MDKEKLARTLQEAGGEPIRQCMQCGKCTACCPALTEMDISPHRFVTLAADGDAESLISSQSLWKCLSCFACVERCPRGVEPASVMEALRLCVIRRQKGNHLAAGQIPVLLDENTPPQLLVSALRKYSK